MTAVLPAPDPPRPNAPTAIAGGRTRVADAIVPRIAEAILSDPPLCHVTFTTIWASRAVSRSLCETRRSHHHNLLTTGRLDRVRRYRKEVRCVPDYRWYPSHRETTAVLRRCSPFGRREFRQRRWRQRERSPTVLAKYPHRTDRRGFHGLSDGWRTRTTARSSATPRRPRT